MKLHIASHTSSKSKVSNDWYSLQLVSQINLQKWSEKLKICPSLREAKCTRGSKGQKYYLSDNDCSRAPAK